ncbi:MAG: glycosyl hydrolase family 8, partial [Thermomicrobiales bacterium]
GNCGRCGNVCKSGWRCLSGTCCAPGTVNCGGTCRQSCGATVGRPFPQHVAYPGAAVRIEHQTEAQQDAGVKAAYDRWKARYLAQHSTDGQGRPRYWVLSETNPDRTVSEAMGFGMVIVATMAGYDPDAQPLFDGLWRMALAYPSCIDGRLMTWQVTGDTPTGGCDSAYDGDADMAYALLLAEQQWGNAGDFDYRAAFDRLIAGIKASTIGPQSRYPMLGDWVTPSGGTFSQWTWRTSDVMPGHLRAWRQATGDAVWDAALSVAQAGIERLQTVYAVGTGLLPDFAAPVSPGSQNSKPAPAGFLEGSTDGDYNYNAGRDPWRIGTDALLSNDATSLAQARRLAVWSRTTTGGNPANLRSGYHLDGTPLPGSNYFSTFFAAPFGVAAMTDPNGRPWLEALYDAVVDASEGYYQDSVTLLSLLVMTGNFWSPGT